MTEELSRPRRLLVLGICCLSLFIVGLDNTIMNLALPSIQHELGASVSGLQWTMDAYILTLASLLMVSGSTADRVGRRRTFQTGLALFTLGSLLCSIAPNVGLLIAFRVLQAIGGSMLNPVAMSIISNTFTDGKERARAIGVWGGVFGLSMALGPVVGGALVGAVGWRSIFWINIPVGVCGFVLAALFVPESRAARPRRMDPVGQLLVMVLLAGLTFGIIEGPNQGWSSVPIVGAFVLAGLAAIGLGWYERRRLEPLLDLRFFVSIPFSGATVTAICGLAAMAGFLFLNSLYLQDVRGYSALHAGLLTLPMAAVMAVCSPISGRIVAAKGPRLPLSVAGVGIVASGLMLTTLTAETPLGLLISAYVVLGLAFGMLNAPITNAAVSGMPRSQAGVASAVASTSRQVGSALGVAVVGSVVTAGVDGPLATGLAPASHTGWWIMTGCGAAVFALALATTGRWAKRTAEKAAVHFEAEPAMAGVAAS